MKIKRLEWKNEWKNFIMIREESSLKKQSFNSTGSRAGADLALNDYRSHVFVLLLANLVVDTNTIAYKLL
jgi:hypothetical protein